MTFGESGSLFEVLNDLEVYINAILDVSLANNKRQHSAACQMSREYFQDAYDKVKSLLENQ